MRIEGIKLVDVGRFREELGEAQIGLFMTGGNGNPDEWVLDFDDCREPVHGYDIEKMSRRVIQDESAPLKYNWDEIVEVIHDGC